MTCPACDGTGCPCWRTRDWQTIEHGCRCGCPECGMRALAKFYRWRYAIRLIEIRRWR